MSAPPSASTLRADSLANEDELAEAIEARKRAAAEAPVTPEQRHAIAALRATILFCSERGLPITVESVSAGATALLRASVLAKEAAAAAPLTDDDVLADALCAAPR